MRFLGAAAGKTKWDRERNVTRREELKQKPLVEQIKKERTQRRGRPRKTWEDVIEELGRQKGKTMREMDKLAKHRKGFSRWTEDPDTGR
jgi:hypothetical protein